MYTPVILNNNNQIVRKGEGSSDLDQAKTTAEQLPIEVGQRPAVVDEDNMIVWRGEVKQLKNGFRPS